MAFSSITALPISFSVCMKLSLFFLSAITFGLIYFQRIPAGILLVFISASLAYLGAYYMKLKSKFEESKPSRNQSLGLAFIITSLITMIYSLQVMGEVIADGKLLPPVYYVFIILLFVAMFLWGRSMSQQERTIASFMQNAAVSASCLYISLHDGIVDRNDLVLVTGLFVWLSTQIVLNRRGTA